MGGHNGTPLRGLDGTALSSIRSGKFGRLFRWLPPAFEVDSSKEQETCAMLVELGVELMTSCDFDYRIDHTAKSPAKPTLTPDVDLFTPDAARDNPEIPAGYTYVGQFIDHDITFDPASSLQRQNDPNTLEDFRTPRLDLDCLYGRGPDDQPYLYQKELEQGSPLRVRFKLGPNRGVPGQRRFDVPRGADLTAVLGDKRNDQNKIISQVHALFLSLHNRVFDDLQGRYPDPRDAHRFFEAQRIVRWTYQWLVLRDFLPKVCGDGIVHSILPAPGSRRPKLNFFKSKSGQAFIPVEFAAAGFRFGHSMVRPSYALNEIATSTSTFKSTKGREASFARIPSFVSEPKQTRDSLSGFDQPLPNHWGIDWNFFFGAIPRAVGGLKQVPQPSYRIDTRLADPLAALPEFTFAGGPCKAFRSLPARNLLRGYRLSLPSGQAVARAMSVRPLDDDELWTTRGNGDTLEDWPEGAGFYKKYSSLLEGRAPLWFYILKEAEVTQRGKRLGAVGARIVAETLIGLAWFDHFSYLYQFPEWTPAAENIDGLVADLDMLNLIAYVG